MNHPIQGMLEVAKETPKLQERRSKRPSRRRGFQTKSHKATARSAQDFSFHRRNNIIPRSCKTSESDKPSVTSLTNCMITKPLSNRPFSSAVSGSCGNSFRREVQTSLSPATSSSSSGGIPRRSQTSRET